ncbi:hypothetical protein DPMN_090857 [Dreissena polymorpha]|uniref:Uncharacterized protein n=2 Tax=Dreissena polymorpha TaxID=45954 RepID=A0A9D4R060_DREPO|nr:hypothetical protein DPMN_090857 [Dreissena polymorpha]
MTEYICMIILSVSFGGNCLDTHCQGYLCCSDLCDITKDNPTSPLNETFEPLNEKFEQCCMRASQKTWSGKEKELLIEYIGVLGKSIVVDPDKFNDSNVYKIEHIGGIMTAIPSNVCDWDRDTLLEVFLQQVHEFVKYWRYIVQIDFSFNKLRKVESLNCLQKLYQLDPSHNKITHFKNTTINQLAHLRHLDLSFNEIMSMDPACISQPTQNVFYANFGKNKLPVVDVTNAFSVNPFCHINYTSNLIDKFVNEFGFTLDANKTYGPGFVSFNFNNFRTFPDFQSLLGLSNLAELGQLVSFGFDFRGIQLDCDCYLEPFLSMVQELKAFLWRDYFNVACANPPSLQGVKVPNLDPYDLVCTLERDADCPQECTCIDRPSTNTLFVNCTNLKTLPEFLPNSTLSRSISLKLSNNDIQILSNKPYLYKVTFLDLSNNLLEQVNDDAIAVLENATLHISNNVRLTQLPQRVQHRNHCITYMEGLHLTYGCQELWIENWLKVKKCDTEKLFKCTIPDLGIKEAREFSC